MEKVITSPAPLRARLRVAALALFAAPAAATQTCPTERVSVDSAGGEAVGESESAAISSDGRYVAFSSEATGLVPGDTNRARDVFVRDRRLGVTTRVSVSSTGAQASGPSARPSISADGRYVAFQSAAVDLVPGDANDATDVFVHDRATGATERVSIDSAGGEASLDSTFATICADGSCVAFESRADDLVAGDTNGARDVFVHDRTTGRTELVSVSSTGAQANDSSVIPSISADGRYVGFSSFASNLVPGDTNGSTDVFVHDRATDLTERVSLASGGAQGDLGSADASLSADGRTVSFSSEATNLVPGDTGPWIDIFVRDRLTSQTTRVSVDSDGDEAVGASLFASISGDGRYVAFASAAPNLVPGDTNHFYDVFVHDRATSETERVSVSSAGEQASHMSMEPAISADGLHVAFESWAVDLVPDDENGSRDVFAHERECSVGTLYCFGDGSGTLCPCGNHGAPGTGCANSTGAGGRLVGHGSASVAADDLAFDATQLPAGEAAALFAARNAIHGGSGAPFGDGLRCAGGDAVRLGTVTTDLAGDATFGPGLAGMGGWSAGDLRTFQVGYRDPAGPCGGGFNLTNGVELTFAP